MEIYLLLILIFLVYHQYKFQSHYPKMINPSTTDNTAKILNDKLKIISQELRDIKRETKIRDVKVIHKVDFPPERRLPQHLRHKIKIKKKINIPTRGYPDDYTLQGIVIRKSDEKTLQLFGRQIYPGSSQWEYFAVGNDSNSFPAKLPVKVKGNRELYDNDIIKLPYLNESKGEFKIKLYKLNSPRYLP